MSYPDGFWNGRKYHLDRMSLRELVQAYFAYPAIQIYLLLGLICGATALWWATSPAPPMVAAVAAVLLYPLVWYLLRRFVLHGSFLYKMEWSVALWKRIHFDHHRDPHDLRVLFGSLVNTLPTIGIVTVPLGWAIGGSPALPRRCRRVCSPPASMSSATASSTWPLSPRAPT